MKDCPPSPAPLRKPNRHLKQVFRGEIMKGIMRYSSWWSPSLPCYPFKDSLVWNSFYIFSPFCIFSDFEWIYLSWSCPVSSWESPLPALNPLPTLPSDTASSPAGRCCQSLFTFYGTHDCVALYPVSSHSTESKVADCSWWLSLKGCCFCLILDGNQLPQMLGDARPQGMREWSPFPACLGPPTAIATGKFQSFA